jgi:hypothetical protein
MTSVRDIINKWPSASEMARDIGLRRPGHGSMMKMRGSIALQHWPKLVEAAKRRGIKGVSFETLALAHASSAKPQTEAAA